MPDHLCNIYKAKLKGLCLLFKATDVVAVCVFECGLRANVGGKGLSRCHITKHGLKRTLLCIKHLHTDTQPQAQSGYTSAVQRVLHENNRNARFKNSSG